ncbi:MAG TPA: hypothetical protein VHW44_28165 [Pseudonocardiaceae bacterium]|jgi:hypothetical protein|nr:hypothetical protein [Pseudonocardiaceae bacterium]
MTDSIALAITLACLGSALIVGVRGLLGRHRWRGVRPMLVLIELALLGQAVADLVGQVRGHRPGEPVTHLAYLVASLAVLPAAAGQTADDDGRWAAALLAVALVGVAVIVVRMETTWRAGLG